MRRHDSADTIARHLANARAHLYGDLPHDGTVPDWDRRQRRRMMSLTPQKAERLKDFVTTIEGIDEERRELGQQKSEQVRLAIEEGFDRRSLKRVLALRRLKPEERDQHEDTVDEYLQALGMTPIEAEIARAQAAEANGNGNGHAAEAEAGGEPTHGPVPGGIPPARGRRRSSAPAPATVN